MILLIDNYDSFVYNLARYVRELGETPLVRRHDALTVDDILADPPSHIIISPGPCSPKEAGISTELVARAGATMPILGVCLGHQCIGAAYGGEIVRAGRPMHGKTSHVHHRGIGLFTGLPTPFRATRYHSLVIAPASVPPELEVIATSEDGEIMAVQHVRDPVYGVQFHPESVLTEHGYRLVDNFLHGTAGNRPVPLAADGALVAYEPLLSTLATDPPPADLVR
ncbi:MAG TPA: aminodeoxychorismate/anthranilate synthase component II [Gemmatimonadales bacterium]